MARKPDEWMPLHIGAYHADTTHLTRDQHGAYLLLLMAYWRRGGALPADDARLAAIVKATPAEWRKLKPIMAEFFREREGAWHQKRADEELTRAVSITDARALAGRVGGIASAAKRQANAQANVKQSTEQNPTPIPLPQQEDTSSLRSDVGRASQKRGRRWGSEETIPREWVHEAHEKRKEMNLCWIDLAYEATRFQNYWAAKAGGSAVKIDWRKTWLNWATDKEKTGNGKRTNAHQNFAIGAFEAACGVEENDSDNIVPLGPSLLAS